MKIPKPSRNEFYRLKIGSFVLAAEIGTHGIYLARLDSSPNQRVAMGPCKIAFREESRGYYAVVKYTSEIRFTLSWLDAALALRVAEAFGMPFCDRTGHTVHKVRFFDSLAFAGLQQWVLKHPTLAKRYHDPNIPNWYHEAVKRIEDSAMGRIIEKPGNNKGTMTPQKERKFEGITNLYGPLREESKERLQRFLDNPTADNWQDISGIMISPMLTVWQAVIAVDPTFPQTGRLADEEGHVVREWERVPDFFTLRRALKYAQELKASA